MEMDRLTKSLKRFVVTKSGCWEFTGFLDKDGYGRIRVKGKDMGAHRAMWIHAFGNPSPGMFVCHTCDNRKCINPEHLFLGTNRDNLADMRAKGRSLLGRPGNAIGEKNGQAVLNEQSVREIRAAAIAGAPRAKLAERFGVTVVAIGLVLSRKRWAHVA